MTEEEIEAKINALKKIKYFSRRIVEEIKDKSDEIPHIIVVMIFVRTMGRKQSSWRIIWNSERVVLMKVLLLSVTPYL